MPSPTTLLHRVGHAVALLALAGGLALGGDALGRDGFVLLTVVGSAVGVWAWSAVPLSRRHSTLHPRTQLVAAGAAAAAVLISAIGFGNLAGFSGLVLLALALSASPVVHRSLVHLPLGHGLLVHRGRRTPSTWTHPSLGNGIVQPLHTMSLEQLCDGWTASYVALAATGDPVLMERLSHLRQAYLDELERRFPSKFHAWLRTHAHPGADPQAHLANDDAA